MKETKERKAARHHVWEQARRAASIAAGICPKCNKREHKPERLWCVECIVKSQEGAEKRREDGRCISCGREPRPNLKTCVACGDAASARARARRKKERETATP